MTQNNVIRKQVQKGGWFRLYNDVLDDMKVQKLTPEQFKGWVNILCLASKNDGILPNADEVAFRLRMDFEHSSSIVNGLITAGLLSVDPRTGNISPHNWKNRQQRMDKSTERVRKHRAKKALEKEGETK